jgi:hypothetical protein
LVNFSNARSALATTFALSGTWANVALERSATTLKTSNKRFLLIFLSFFWIGEYLKHTSGKHSLLLKTHESKDLLTGTWLIPTCCGND